MDLWVEQIIWIGGVSVGAVLLWLCILGVSKMGSGLIWTIVGILLIIALIIFIF